MTPELLKACTGCTDARAQEFALPLTQAMAAYGITTPQRRAAFLAQITVESGGLHWLRELWGPTKEQKRYDPPGDLANQLGNTVVGDGFFYRGGGLIETTGKGNYYRLSVALKHDFVVHPEDIVIPIWASLSAALYWHQHGCNELADVDNFPAITRAINGGLTAEIQRMSAWNHCKKLLGVK